MINYRPEIDGLRSISVFAVLFYHLDFSLFEGGFLGVDIFFVISGYLITKIIIEEIENNRFSILLFYKKRIRRILPLLYFITAFSSILSYFLLFPRDLQEYGESLVAILFFSSNIYFWIKSGYFDVSAELRPLLHTWSLSIEEQYYIIYPFFVIFIKRIKENFLVITLFLLFTSSLIYSQIQSYNSPESNFYLIFSRVWQITSGCLAFHLERKINILKIINKDVLSAGGLILIVGSILYFDKNTPSPSILTFIPVFGVCSILLCKESSFIKDFLSLRYFSYLGKLSYGIYLWHFPIISYLKYLDILKFNYQKWLVILFSIILSHFSYKYIENPIRRKKLLRFNSLLVLIFITSISFLIFGLKLHNSTLPEIARMQNKESWMYQFDLDQIQKRSIETVKKTGVYKPVIKKYPSSANDTKKVLIIGDSMADDAFASIKLKDPNYFIWKIIFDDICLDFNNNSKGCILSRRMIEQKYPLIQKADLIIFMVGFYKNTKIKSLLKIFKNEELEKFIIISPAHFEGPYSVIGEIQRKEITIKNYKELDLIYGRNISRYQLNTYQIIKKKIKGMDLDFISGYDLQCEKINGEYSCPFIRNGNLLMFDTAHKTIEGFDLYGDQLMSLIKNKLY